MKAAARQTNRRVAVAVLLLVGLALLAAFYAAHKLDRTKQPVQADRLTIVARTPAAPAPPPVPPPLTIIDGLTFEQARVSNAAIPLATGPIVPAQPFRYAGAPQDRSAAVTCLAAAVLYEAGDDRPGEQAVAQVVLNRLRHPAFPKTVCGVVFQGAERRTGCQFTFTCDGALARSVQPDAWRRARAIAEAALAGEVFAPVGTATHYHTDWVVPYWRSSLEKVAQVHTQIFYRWPGWWGKRAAFAGVVLAPEAIDPRIAGLADPATTGLADAALLAGRESEGPRATLSIEGVPATALKGNIVRLANETATQFVLQLDPAAFPGSWAVVGYTICAARADCMVMGWTSEAQTPRALPVMPNASPSMAFLYRKSSAMGLAQPYWDCARFARVDRTQCLPGTALRSPGAGARYRSRPSPQIAAGPSASIPATASVNR